jgi:hypothetical protein
LGFQQVFLVQTCSGFQRTNAVATIDNLSITISTIPEPETYAMLLAGLGLLRFIGRRAKKTNVL